MSQIREKEGELEKCVSLNDDHFIFNLMFTHSLLIENPVTRSRQSMVRYRKCSKSRNERTSSCRNPKQYHTSPSPNIFCKKGEPFDILGVWDIWCQCLYSCLPQIYSGTHFLYGNHSHTMASILVCWTSSDTFKFTSRQAFKKLYLTSQVHSS